MNDVQVGAAIRVLRLRRGWRQVDVARAAGLSQQEISTIELGRLDQVSIRALRGVTRVLDARCSFDLRWSGGLIDRLLDEQHAGLVGQAAAELRRLGWQADIEVSYAHYAERGSIDLSASRPDRRIAVIVEVKSRLVSVEAMLRKLDQKVRLADTIVRRRLNWQPVAIARLLVLPATDSARAQVSRQRLVLGAAFPLRGTALRAWLAEPTAARSPVSGLLYVTPTRNSGGNSAVTRVRARRAA